MDDVARGLVDKLVRRHPHVFGEVEVSGADEVLVNWERIKADEKGGDAARPRGRHPGAAARPRARVEGAAASGRVRLRLAHARGRAGEAARGDRRARVPATPEEAEAELGDVLFAAAAVARRSGRGSRERAAPYDHEVRASLRGDARAGRRRGRRSRRRWTTTRCSRTSGRRGHRRLNAVTGDADERSLRTIAFERWLSETTADRVDPTPHGRVCTSPSFPRRYDSNFLWVTRHRSRARRPRASWTPRSARRSLGFEHRRDLGQRRRGRRGAWRPGFAELGYEATRLVVMAPVREPDLEPEVPVARGLASRRARRSSGEHAARALRCRRRGSCSLVGWRRPLEDAGRRPLLRGLGRRRSRPAPASSTCTRASPWWRTSSRWRSSRAAESPAP